MFIDIRLNRKDRIKTWITAAMNANIMAQVDASSGKIETSRLANILEGIVEGATTEILKELQVRVQPSVN